MIWNRITDPNLEQFDHLRLSSEGVEAIYREVNALVHVRVNGIKADDQGASVEIADLLSEGMTRSPSSPSSIWCCWEKLDYGEHCFYSNYPALWKLYFAPAIVKQVRGILASSGAAEDRKVKKTSAIQVLKRHDRERINEAMVEQQLEGDARLALRAGDYDQVLNLLAGSKSPVNLCLRAVAYAAKGDTANALTTLQKSFDAGYRKISEIDTSRYFSSLRQHPQLVEVVRQYRK